MRALLLTLHFQEGSAEREDVPVTELPQLPNLFSLGYWKILTGDVFDHRSAGTTGLWGRLRRRSPGTDLLGAHWELAGATLDAPVASLETLPAKLLAAVAAEARVRFLELPTRGEIGPELWAEHRRTGLPIARITSLGALELAGEETAISRGRLFEIGHIARRHADAWRVPKVLAQSFTRKEEAADASTLALGLAPPPTVLNALEDYGFAVEWVGPVPDHFAGSGITRGTACSGAEDILAGVAVRWRELESGLVAAPLPIKSGEPRSAALARLDAWLGEFLQEMEEDDLLILADLSCPLPATAGGAGAVAEIPIMVQQPRRAGPLGVRQGYDTVAATLADFFEVREAGVAGVSCFRRP